MTFPNFTSSNTILEAFGKVKYLIDNIASIVLGTTLTGLSAAAGTFTSSDTILTALNKCKYLIDNVAGQITTALATFKTTNFLDATSSIQTQLNSKLNKSKYISQGYTTLTGVTSQTVIASLLIPANTYATTESFEVIVSGFKTVTASSVFWNVYHDTTINGITNTIATSIGIVNSQRTVVGSRFLTVDGTTLRNSAATGTSNLTPFASTSTVFATPTTFNPAVDNYITITVNPTVGSEVVGINFVSIRPL